MRRCLLCLCALALLLALPLGARAHPPFSFHDLDVDSFFDIWLEGTEIISHEDAIGDLCDLYIGDPDPGPMYPTEITALDITLGSNTGDTIHVTLESSQPSSGTIVGDPSPGYPADSFFDVYFQIRIGDGPILHNNTPAHYVGTCNSFFDVFVGLSGPVDLCDYLDTYCGYIEGSWLQMSPEPSSVAGLAVGLLPLAMAIRRARPRR